MLGVKEIRELLKQGETHNVEFKAKFDGDKVGQAIAAFANDWPGIGYGVLLIGIDDKTKKVIGIQENVDQLQQSVANTCRGGAMLPSLAPLVYSVQLEGPVLVVEVTATNDLPCRYRDECYIRIGSTTRRAAFHEELALYRRRKVEKLRAPLVDRLPPREQYFVGRQKELGELWQWMRDGKSFRHALAGDGGKGKTAIAYEFACRIAEVSPDPYELVLWASAKKKQFVGGRIVPIAAPDFHDLSSLLNKLLCDIGFPEDVAMSVEEKKDKVTELLKLFPALIVIDDLDSLDWSKDEDTMEFATYDLPHANCKILITSRRQIPTVHTTYVGGFTESDGQAFIRSRIQLAGMPSDTLVAQQMNELLAAADSSPLYVEDLLRFFITDGDLQNTIHLWIEKGGEEARAYALKRELEMLSKDAVLVLLAFSVLDRPASAPEGKAVANLTWPKWNEAVNELQRLFLVPRPGIIEGLPRFSVNSNTKSLVLQVMKGRPELTRVREAATAMTGRVYQDLGRRSQIGACVSQAAALVRSGDYPMAEATLSKGLDKFGQDPDLIGAVGWLYKSWRPPRNVEAREQFLRSAELKCKNGEMYRHWYEMEEQLGNWDGASEAAEAARKVFEKNILWTFRLGYALSRQGQLLANELQPRAAVYLARAERILARLADDIDQRSIPIDADLDSRVCRALVVNTAALYRSASESSDKQKYLSQLAFAVRRWDSKHGSDPSVDYEIQKLLHRIPELKGEPRIASQS